MKIAQLAHRTGQRNPTIAPAIFRPKFWTAPPVATLLVDVFLPSNQQHHVQVDAEESPQLPR
jgi:hypothetical protein